MLTKEEALKADEFHFGTCTVYRVETWWRNGRTKVWITWPNRFQVPVKRGLYQYGYIDDKNCEYVHAADACPIGKEKKVELTIVRNPVS